MLRWLSFIYFWWNLIRLFSLFWLFWLFGSICFLVRFRFLTSVCYTNSNHITIFIHLLYIFLLFLLIIKFFLFFRLFILFIFMRYFFYWLIRRMNFLLLCYLFTTRFLLCIFRPLSGWFLWLFNLLKIKLWIIFIYSFTLNRNLFSSIWCCITISIKLICFNWCLISFLFNLRSTYIKIYISRSLFNLIISIINNWIMWSKCIWWMITILIKINCFPWCILTWF